jgi:hypothetical protein
MRTERLHVLVLCASPKDAVRAASTTAFFVANMLSLRPTAITQSAQRFTGPECCILRRSDPEDDAMNNGRVVIVTRRRSRYRFTARRCSGGEGSGRRLLGAWPCETDKALTDTGTIGSSCALHPPLALASVIEWFPYLAFTVQGHSSGIEQCWREPASYCPAQCASSYFSTPYAVRE